MKIPYSLFRTTIVSTAGDSASYPFFSIDKEGKEIKETDVKLYSSLLKDKYAVIKLNSETKYRILEFMKCYEKGLVDFSMQYGKPWLRRWARYVRNNKSEIMEIDSLEESIETYRKL